MQADGLFDSRLDGNQIAQVMSNRLQTSLGIGLYIAREIVLAHQGSIDVTSSSSSGTVFKISLPRHPT